MTTFLTADNFNTVPVATTTFSSADNFNVAGTIVLLPGQPNPVTVTGFDSSATLVWALADQGSGTFTGYTITATNGATGDVYTYAVGNVTTVTLLGLTNTNQYTVVITAQNSFGNGVASNGVLVTPTSGAGNPDPAVPSVLPSATSPGAPTLVSVTASDGMAAITWTAPSFAGFSNITGYHVEATSAGVGVVTYDTNELTLGITVGHLVNGSTYTFAVYARNAVGTSVSSNTINGTPAAGLPGVDLPPDVTPPDAPDARPVQPVLQAFPSTFPFKPSNWNLTPEEAAANG